MSDWHGSPGARWKHIEDGKNFVYIKTTWLTLFVTACVFVGFGYWLGR